MRRGLLVAVLALAVVDITLLIGAWRDRASDDVVLLTLDERELRLVPSGEASSAILLRLATHADRLTRESPAAFQPPWIDEDQLTRLGFDCSMWLADPRAPDHYRRQLARPAFVAFDVGTDAWRARLDAWRARLGSQPMRQAPTTGDVTTSPDLAIAAVTARSSRLVPMEIAADKAALRGKYRVRPATLILPVVVGISFHDGAPPLGRPLVQGRINALHPRTIAVPARLRAVFAGLAEASPEDAARRAADALPHAPRYDVTLAIGPALRPWVVDARRLGHVVARP